MTFNVTVITNGETSIKTRKGVANNVVEESITETDLLLTNVQAGTMLTDVALFVDSDSQALGEQAQTKYWRRGGWGGGWCAPHTLLHAEHPLLPNVSYTCAQHSMGFLAAFLPFHAAWHLPVGPSCHGANRLVG